MRAIEPIRSIFAFVQDADSLEIVGATAVHLDD